MSRSRLLRRDTSEPILDARLALGAEGPPTSEEWRREPEFEVRPSSRSARPTWLPRFNLLPDLLFCRLRGRRLPRRSRPPLGSSCWNSHATVEPDRLEDPGVLHYLAEPASGSWSSVEQHSLVMCPAIKQHRALFHVSQSTMACPGRGALVTMF